MEGLNNKLQQTLQKIKSKTLIKEEHIQEAIKAIKVSLLEADVNLEVVKKLIENIKTKTVGEELITGVNAGEQFVKVVNDEIVSILHSDISSLKLDRKITKIMLVGLQGSGKTTTVSKLAKYLENKENKKPLIVAADIYRPAAIEQLKKLGSENSFEVFEKGLQAPEKTVREAMEYAKENNFDTVIVDTAGRLHIDSKLMEELSSIKKAFNPQEILIVIDSMSGQEMVNVTKGFNEKLAITGAILTKTDGDSRGGSVLSVKFLTGIPIKFIANGEKVDNLEVFSAVKVANRILGLSDVAAFVEEAKELITEETAIKLAKKMMSGNFNLNDMLQQLKSVQKLGTNKFMAMIPGIPKITEEQKEKITKDIQVMEALIYSMTKKERKEPKLLKDNSRKQRVINGSGRNAQDFNKLIKKHAQTMQISKMLKGNKGMMSGNFPRF